MEDQYCLSIMDQYGQSLTSRELHVSQLDHVDVPPFYEGHYMIVIPVSQEIH